MRLQTILAFSFILSGVVVQGRQELQTFDKSTFYIALASENVNDINVQLAIVATTSMPEKEAYKGALLMRKAGLLRKAADKLKFFKAGYIQLESALKKDSTNGEYHFLRLTIQEHAPRTVKYFKDLETDSLYIQNTFKGLSPVVQKAIIDYSKNSKILNPEDFNQK
ncbi:MAG: hypothetical protein JJE22_18445 [Bacteroidia bacterium]|nr:hypothetical protein [Bacteroidia bacterium]